MDDAAGYLEIPVDRVHACLRYYGEFTVEIDDWQQRAASVRDREEAMARRQREVMG